MEKKSHTLNCSSEQMRTLCVVTAVDDVGDLCDGRLVEDHRGFGACSRQPQLKIDHRPSLAMKMWVRVCEAFWKYSTSILEPANCVLMTAPG